MKAADYRTVAARAMTEADLQAQVIAAAKSLKWLAYHTHDSRRSEPGFPDLVLVHPLHGILFRELKTETGRISKDQDRWISGLARAGANVTVWRPRDLLSGAIIDQLQGRRK